MSSEELILIQISELANSSTKDNVGDNYVQAIDLYNQIQNTNSQPDGEFLISRIRALARDADIGWSLFKKPINLNCDLTEDDQIRLITLVSFIKSFCYGVERLDEVSSFTGPNSTPLSFYINSLYHYIAALYLLDKGNNPIGGAVYKSLQPIGLEYLLEPVQFVLDKKMADDITFGETVRSIRNRFLVHGTFSPEDISLIVGKTQLRYVKQQVLLTNLIWELFNQTFILRLKILSILTRLKSDLNKLFQNYLEK